MIGYIYLITNNINNKQYIGQHRTDNIDDCYMGSGVALHRAYKKYGLENFTKEILFYTVSKSVDNLLCVLNTLEKFYIRRYNTFKDGYNMTEGGEGSLGREAWNKGLKNCYSEEVRKKMSEAAKGNKNALGRKHSEEEIRKMSEAAKGEKNPNYGKQTWNKGIPNSEKTRAKISASLKGRHIVWNEDHTKRYWK